MYMQPFQLHDLAVLVCLLSWKAWRKHAASFSLLASDFGFCYSTSEVIPFLFEWQLQFYCQMHQLPPFLSLQKVPYHEMQAMLEFLPVLCFYSLHCQMTAILFVVIMYYQK